VTSVYKILAEELDCSADGRALFLSRWRRWINDELDIVELTPFMNDWGWKPNLFLHPERLQISLSHHLEGEQLEAVIRANKRLDALVGRDRPRLRLGPLAAHDLPLEATFSL
jgi:hypothetical protein